MDVLIIEYGLVRPDTVVGSFAAQIPRNIKLGQFVVPDPASDVPASAFAAETPTVGASGTVTVTPVSAVMGFSAGGDGPAVAADGGAATVADYVRRGFPPSVVRIPESLFPSHSPAQVLVTGLKDLRTPGQEHRTITVEEF